MTRGGEEDPDGQEETGLRSHNQPDRPRDLGKFRVTESAGLLSHLLVAESRGGQVPEGWKGKREREEEMSEE